MRPEEKRAKKNARSNAWRKANPEKDKARARARYAAHPEKYKARSNAWRKANPEEHKACSNAWRKANPEKDKARSRAHYRKKNGFTPWLIAALLVSQGHACRLCRAPLTEKTAHADHDHDTGEPRALLCPTCNKLEGMLRAAAKRGGLSFRECADELVQMVEAPLAQEILELIK